MTHPTTAIFLFLAGMGIVMVWTLWWWQRAQNGNRRIGSWVVAVQATAWTLLLARASWAYVFEADLRPPPSLWNLAGVALMNLGLCGHIYYILKRKYQGEKRGPR